jgi:hypothetical protein
MEFTQIKEKISTQDFKYTLRYYKNNFLYALLIGSSIIALSRNYKKAMENEEDFLIFKMYKQFKNPSEK